MHCPACQSDHGVKNGLNPIKKQLYRCKDCGRQFVLKPAKMPSSDGKEALIDPLLLERILLAGIARSVGASESWLQNYLNNKYMEVPHEIVAKKRSQRQRYFFFLNCH